MFTFLSAPSYGCDVVGSLKFLKPWHPCSDRLYTGIGNWSDPSFPMLSVRCFYNNRNKARAGFVCTYSGCGRKVSFQIKSPPPSLETLHWGDQDFWKGDIYVDCSLHQGDFALTKITTVVYLLWLWQNRIFISLIRKPNVTCSLCLPSCGIP